ncbi:T6SS effector BTH_I2691 family protein [Psychrobacter sp. PAMC 21119]|uniref:T6SS effector BTH_I2691 family protein n=1 Tax=Psychrobacter sp. PAMC 21119 TaxID=1112209 RepID=UPI000289E41A|nr:T6SS effector BTH_I2691 family protein [Psychrobacter sp. PAMC 21119]
MAERCEQCLADGIAILPVRWGYRFKEKELKIVSRLLREGYVYILDNNGEWYGYIITQGRYLKSFTVTGISGKLPYSNEPDLPYADSTCLAGSNCQALNSFIRIPNPNKDIDTLWIAYSPVKWTKAVIERHQNNTDGAKTNNMIEVPVSVTQSSSKSSLELSESQNGGGYNLWEYDPDGEGKDPITQYYATEYLNYINPFTKQPYAPDKSHEEKSLTTELSKIESSDNRVLNVYFNDEVGKLIDLNEMMLNIEDYYDSKLLKSMFTDSFDKLNQKQLVANTILDIEKQIKANAPQYVAKQKSEALRTPTGANVALFSSREDLIRGYYKKNWENGFKDSIRYEEMLNWLSLYSSTQASNDRDRKKQLAILVERYKNMWFSEYLNNEMTYNFDNTDVDSCASYTLTVQNFVGSTAKYSEVAESYMYMLSLYSLLKPYNYLGRACCFNNETMISEIESISTSGITIDGIVTLSWSAAAGEILSKIKNQYLEKIKKSGTTITLENLIFDPYLYIRKKGVERKVTSTSYPNIRLGRSDLLMSIFTRRPLSVVTVEGNIRDITKGVYGLLKTELSKNGGSQLSNNKLRDAASQFVDQMKNEGIDIDKNISTKVTAFVSIDALTSANGAKSSAGVAKSMMTDRRLQFEEFKSFYKNQAAQSGVGNFGGVLQVLSCLSLFKGVVESADTDAKEPLHKFGGSIAILAGGVVQHRADVVGLRRELYGAVPTDSPHRQLKLARMLEGTEVAYSSLKAGARGLNIGGAAVFAYYDYQAAQENYANDDVVMGTLYLTSAGSGVISTTLLVFGVSGSWVPIAGWVILGVSIVAGLAIMWFQKTPLEKWVKYGTWGIDSNEWSLDFEKAQLEKASEGIEIDIKDN